MSNASSPSNIPPPSEKRGDSQEKTSARSENSLHDRFLEDISKQKHIPEIAKEAELRNSILGALLNSKAERTINDSAREFRVLGGNFINRSVYMGLSRQMGQMPFLALFKGEMRDSLREQDAEKLSLRLAATKQKEKIEKDKEAKETGKAKEKGEKSKEKKESKASEDKDLLVEPILKEQKLEKMLPEGNEKPDTDSKYDIIDEIRKATEFELSNLSANEEQMTLYSRLEKPQVQEGSSAGAESSNVGISIERLKKCIANFSKGKILVVGDLLIDELLEGKPERISREAPVLILEHVDTVLIPGGAANTAHNVTALGGQCHTVGVCGNDEYANKLASLLHQSRITHDLIVDPLRPTTVKTRILSKTHALMQQLLRLDRISHDTIDSATASRLIEKLEAVIAKYPLLIISDYRGGLITDEIVHACRKLVATHDLKLIVDAQDDFERFQNVSLITPNQPDTERAVGYKIDSESDLLKAGEDMLLLTGAQAVLITRGKEGMVLFEHGQKPFSLPAFNRSEIYDVSGAGDTVVSTISLALATGASMPEAVVLGNIAASLVVKKPGTAVTDPQEMLASLASIDWLVNQS